MTHEEDAGCPICGMLAWSMRLDEVDALVVECENCTSFTITRERIDAFREAWRVGDRETLMCLEAISSYLRRGGDDCDREITDTTWMSFAIDGDHMNDESPEKID